MSEARPHDASFTTRATSAERPRGCTTFCPSALSRRRRLPKAVRPVARRATAQDPQPPRPNARRTRAAVRYPLRAALALALLAAVAPGDLNHF
ncbi:MAG: hypothetical protein JSU66_04420, partial [Deltaproteobacteria bacterium]